MPCLFSWLSLFEGHSTSNSNLVKLGHFEQSFVLINNVFADNRPFQGANKLKVDRIKTTRFIEQVEVASGSCL